MEFTHASVSKSSRSVTFTLFVFASIGHGGISGFYRECAGIGEQVLRDRGYYFIKGQSHYPGDRLPDEFSLPTDTPDKLDTAQLVRAARLVRGIAIDLDDEIR